MMQLQNETYIGYTEFNEEDDDMQIINGELYTDREVLTAEIMDLKTQLASAERAKLEGARNLKQLGVAPEAISAGLGLSLQAISAL
jgi:hypothetical protein